MLVLRLTIVGDIVRPMGPSKTASRVGVSVGLAVLIVVIGSFGFGPRGLTIGVVATFLMLAWRHDNSAGLLFPIAMLIVITIAVLLLLMYLMARMHSQPNDRRGGFLPIRQFPIFDPISGMFGSVL